MKWSELPTPCYVVDEALIEENLKVLRGVMERTGARILLAQKAFSMYALYPLISRYLCGATASGLYEARLCAEEMTAPVENHIYSPAFREEDFGEILKYSDHIVFNSWRQVEKFGERAKHEGKSIGLRVNPECSTQEGHAIYDPCATAGKRERKPLPIVWADRPVWRGTLSVTTPLTESWRRGTGWFLRTWRSTPW